MDFLTLAKTRFSVRKYDAKPIEKEKLDRILEAGRVAPTAANLQPQRLLVIQSKEGLEKLKKGANVYGAPLAIIVAADHNKSWKRPFDGKDVADIDASIITDHMMMEATALGLGTVWVCYFDPKIIKEQFEMPEHIEPLNILAVGYPNEPAASTERHQDQRLPMEKTVFFEQF